MKLIPLTQGKFAKVDDADFEWISQWKWQFIHGYAVRTIRSNGKQKPIFMHIEIVGAQEGLEIDHVDLDKINNQRENLRHCTHAENVHNTGKRNDNTSGYKGVFFHKQHYKWNAQIRVDGKRKSLGDHLSSKEAALAYDAAAKKLFGEFAKTNF